MDNKANNSILEIAKRLKAMAETGLLFTQDEYDKERYEELKELSFELMAQQTSVATNEITDFFANTSDYPTPKVDVRAVILNEKGQLLMVQEKCDNQWTIPGGWCEIGLSPKENIIKEIKEETGLDAKADQLIAVFDKKCHPHPARPHYVYKLVFHCSIIHNQELKPNFEILNAQYFDKNKLPELSRDRIVEDELKIIFNKISKKDYKAYSD